MKITMRQVREAGLCARGARRFAEKYGLDWQKFLSEGIEAEELIATGDGLAVWLVEKTYGKR